MDTLVTTKPHPRHVFEVREIGGVMVQLWQNYFEECGLLIVSVQKATNPFFDSLQHYHLQQLL
eukprot:SAG31_NODE_644_length_13275_cov_39.464633_9_plen_63_part_00